MNLLMDIYVTYNNSCFQNRRSRQCSPVSSWGLSKVTPWLMVRKKRTRDGHGEIKVSLAILTHLGICELWGAHFHILFFSCALSFNQTCKLSLTKKNSKWRVKCFHDACSQLPASEISRIPISSGDNFLIYNSVLGKVLHSLFKICQTPQACLPSMSMGSE